MNSAVVAILHLLLTTQVFGSEVLNCSSQSCLNDPSCLDKCLEDIDLFESETSDNSDCSSESCLNDPTCLDKCLEENGRFEVDASKKVFERLDALENENDDLKDELHNLEKHLESIEENHQEETRNITNSLNLVKNKITELENSQVETTTVLPSNIDTIRKFTSNIIFLMRVLQHLLDR